MKVDRCKPEEMNWVDYCDSLSNEFFTLRAGQLPPPPLDSMPNHAAFVKTLHEMARELT